MYQINSVQVNVPPGSIVAWPSDTIPSGWAKCDGSAYNATTYPSLHTALGSPVTPVLPNLNAAYLRGTGTGGGYSGPGLNSFANDQTKGHTHTFNDPGHSHQYYRAPVFGSDGGTNPNRTSANANTTLTTGSNVSGISLQNAGGSETRPYTYVINWIIKLG